jgi:hypothetical protein
MKRKVAGIVAALAAIAFAVAWWSHDRSRPSAPMDPMPVDREAGEAEPAPESVPSAQHSTPRRAPVPSLRLLKPRNPTYDECRVRWTSGTDPAAIHRPIHSPNGIVSARSTHLVGADFAGTIRWHDEVIRIEVARPDL